MDLKQSIIDNLKEVYDPEIPINVYDLGLIYDVQVKKSGDVFILMTLTSPTCPTAEYIQTMVEEAVKSVEGVSNVDIELTFEPAWTPDRVSPEAKDELGLNGDDINTSSSQTKKICFNCLNDESNFPIFLSYYKGEEVYICSKCLVKF